MKLILAPMEGVVDYYMRDLLTYIGGYDLCISEFLRVTNTVFPESVFHRICPELLHKEHQSHTNSGVPVRLQILGQDAQMMAENSHKAVTLGIDGIDLNFGCPAKTVNCHGGGASLLSSPNSMANIISSVRNVIPDNTHLSVKMRLGIDNVDDSVAIAKNVQDAGANEITIHARTKAQGYKPPVHWYKIAEIRQTLTINVIANGDVVDYKSYCGCKKATLCNDIMIGRGALMNPLLAKSIKSQQQQLPKWQDIVEYILLNKEMLMKANVPEKYYLSRIKQWLNYLRVMFLEAERDFKQVRTMRCAQQVNQYFSHISTKSC